MTMHPATVEAIRQMRARQGPVYDRWLRGRVAYAALTGLTPNT